jgi:hypothetical protein
MGREKSFNQGIVLNKRVGSLREPTCTWHHQAAVIDAEPISSKSEYA